MGPALLEEQDSAGLDYALAQLQAFRELLGDPDPQSAEVRAYADLEKEDQKLTLDEGQEPWMVGVQHPDSPVFYFYVRENRIYSFLTMKKSENSYLLPLCRMP